MHRRGFPAEAIEALGYSAIWHGQKSWNGVALLSRVGEPVETRRALPERSEPGAEPLHRGGDLRHPRRQHVCAQRQSLARARSSITSWHGWTALHDACARPARQRRAGAADRRLQRHPDRRGRLQAGAMGKGRAVRATKRGRSLRELVAQGWTDAIRHLHPDERIYTFWHYWRNSFQRDAGIRIDHALLSPASPRASRPPASTARRAGGKRPATTRRFGSRWRFELQVLKPKERFDV